jgi:integrase
MENERIKRAYFTHLKGARGLSEATIDAAAKAIHRFEMSTGFRSFKTFHIEQAIAFRRRLDEDQSERSGEPLSKATAHQALRAMRSFILWLAEQPGYRRRIRYSDADYFRLSEKDTRIAKSSRPREVPTPHQIEKALSSMPFATEVDRRNRALIAFTWLTGVRDGALASLKVKHLTLEGRFVDQDPREVRTKNSKAQVTTFFPVGGTAESIVVDWVNFLLIEQAWGREDPLFPATLVEQDQNRQFRAAGLARRHWANAGPIRAIFKEAFEAAGLPAFNPHSFRHALALLGERICKTPEEFKAWSQNLGHEQVLTTLSSYGAVAPHRQAEIVKSLGEAKPKVDGIEMTARRVVELMRENG